MDVGELIRKYAGPGPRYTSYPTAPQWSDSVGAGAYAERLKAFSQASGPTLANGKRLLGMYVHIPFCESLCYYCGCNIQITHDRSRSAAYVRALSKELALLSDLLGPSVSLSQVSWGGGTPTFLSLQEIETLYSAIQANFPISDQAEVSIEVDPRVTSDAQLELLRTLGFNRVSLGVQDFDDAVQKAINRVQPMEMTAKMLEKCRSLGFRGINFDLIYGLPLQSMDSFRKTLQSIVEIGPDRIALYNYARLPALLKHQTILEKHPMPSADERVQIFLMALETLQNAGYIAIGMDHFAKKTDELAHALGQGALYRNFMGYTVRKAEHMVGVGASAIGEVAGGFFQNTKRAVDYEKCMSENRLATQRGLLLTPDDLHRQWVIQSLMCGFKLDTSEFKARFGVEIDDIFRAELEKLVPFVEQGILSQSETGFRVSDVGRLFLRNVAMVFDAYLSGKQQNTFSQTV
jgi:oxygen-independent coproporphyrinogen III oxidase